MINKSKLSNKLSIEEAISLSGLSKPTFYKKYFHTEKLKKNKIDGIFYIRLADFLYYFPNAIIEDPEPKHDNKAYTLLEAENSRLKADIDYLRDDIKERKEREQNLLNLIDRLTVKAIEHKPVKKKKKKKKWAWVKFQNIR